MRRRIRWVMGLVVVALAGWIPPADATGTALCTISGTITFSRSEMTSTIGTWTIGPAKGTFQVAPPYKGDCVTTPVTSALFVAQGWLLRFYPPDPDRYKPWKPRPF